MANNVQQSGTPINKTSSAIVSSAAGTLLGYHVNSTTSGTIVLRDGILSNSAAVTGTITPLTGFTAFCGSFPNGCFATIGGTLDVTFIFAAG